MLTNFFHKLFHPHCLECRYDDEQKRLANRNELIDEYKEMLASARLEISRLTQALVDLTKEPEVINQVIQSNAQPLPRKMRMSELANKLTRESQEEANRIREIKAKETNDLRPSNDIDKLESSLGIN